MAAIDTHKVAKKDRPLAFSGSPTFFRKRFTLSAGNQDDTVSIIDIPHNFAVRNAVLTVSGTLGASCTILLARGATALTAATSATNADREVQSVTDTPTTSGTEGILNVTIGGAAVGTAATVTVECDLAPVPAGI